MSESDFGKIILCNPILKETAISLALIEGKLYARDKLKKTRNSQKKVVPYLVIDATTLQVYDEQGNLEPIAQDSN